MRKKFILGLLLVLAMLVGCAQATNEDGTNTNAEVTYTYEVQSVAKRIEKAVTLEPYRKTYNDMVYTVTYVDNNDMVWVEDFSIHRNSIYLSDSNQVIVTGDNKSLYLTEDYLQLDTLSNEIVQGNQSEDTEKTEDAVGLGGNTDGY